MELKSFNSKLEKSLFDSIMNPIYINAEKTILKFLIFHNILSLILANFYDTWKVSLAILFLNNISYYTTRKFFPNSLLCRSFTGIILQTFTALHIYQMHGLAEMHFFFFTSFVIMIVYLDPICMWPGAILIIFQHIIFALLHNSGYSVFFFEDSYVNFTKLFFHFGIAVVHVALCGYWSNEYKKKILTSEANRLEVEKVNQNLLFKEEELEKALLKAEELSEFRSEFLSVMSHEIRTPLNGIVGYSNLLADENPRQDQIEMIDSLKFSSNHLLGLVNDILDYNKIEAGKLNLEYISFSILELAKNTKHIFDIKAKEKNNSIEFEIDDKIPIRVMGDPLRLGQILSNLLSNACKFTVNGKIFLKISIEEINSDRFRILFSIKDSGIGIPIDKQKAIFQKFTQANSSTARDFGGTGLGLSISKNLLELMGSEIQLRSELNKGSEFYFIVPFEAAKEKENMKNLNLDFKFKFEPRILLVDDNVMNLNIGERFLKKWGINPIPVTSGVEAIQKLSTEKFSAILLDIQMPEMDGYETAKQIRKFNSKIPIIALTASMIHEVRDKAIDSGMNNVASKPFKPDEILKLIYNEISNQI